MSARARRRSFPIHAYIGANGGGKSLLAVYDSLPDLAAGRPVVSTVKILDAMTGQPHPLWVPLDSYRLVLEAERCRMILDEVTGVASSRESMSMPASVANTLVQLRRRDVSLAWTAPAWARSDRIIRECTQAVTLCRGFRGERVHDPEGDRLWTSKRWFYFRSYDAAAFDEWSAYRKERLRPDVRQWLRRDGGAALASRSYDTFDAVLSLRAVTDAGYCMDCGGRRTAPKCSCPPDSEKGVRDPDQDFAGLAPAGRRILTIAETDDTPAVALEVPSPDPLAG